MSNGSKGRRTFGSIRRLPSGRWQAGYPDRSGRTQTAPNTFMTKADAARYLALVEADLTRNVFHDPKKGRTPFRVWARTWLDTLTNLRPTTRGQYRYLLGKLVEPTFGEVALADIDPVAVRAWLAELEARPSIRSGDRGQGLPDVAPHPGRGGRGRLHREEPLHPHARRS